LAIQVDAVLASSYARAWATAEILHAEAMWASPTIFPELEPGTPPAVFVEALRRRTEESIALAGHEHQLSSIASLLLSGSPDLIEAITGLAHAAD
jgi:phosphohistidine phosphatase SixA